MSLYHLLEVYESTSLADRIIKRPSVYGSVARDVKALQSMFNNSVPRSNAKNILVFKMPNGKVIGLEQGKAVNRMKREGDSRLTYLGRMLPRYHRGQTATWMPER